MTEVVGVQEQKSSVYMVVWIILLVVIAWPLAWFVAPIWIILLPFEAVLAPGTFRVKQAASKLAILLTLCG